MKVTFFITLIITTLSFMGLMLAIILEVFFNRMTGFEPVHIVVAQIVFHSYFASYIVMKFYPQNIDMTKNFVTYITMINSIFLLIVWEFLHNVVADGSLYELYQNLASIYSTPAALLIVVLVLISPMIINLFQGREKI